MATNTVNRRGCRYLLPVVLLLAAILAPASGPAQDHIQVETVDVVGTSAITEDDPAGMREKALANGLDEAVLQVAAQEVPPDVFTRNAEAIRSVLLANTQRYIENYRVLEEFRAESDYQVRVEATVSKSLIDEELRRAGVLKSAVHLPKVLFLTSQQNLTDGIPRYWWSGNADAGELTAENAMVETLAQKGFEVIGRTGPEAAAAAADWRLAPHLDDRQAIDLATRLGADAVVVGHSAAQAAAAEAGQGLRKFKATAIVRALAVPSGDLLATVKEDFTTTDSDERLGGMKALAGVGAAAGRSLAAQMASSWASHEREASALKLEVEGTRALPEFVRFRKALEATEGVRGVRIERLEANRALLDVEFDGGAGKLAERLTAGTYPSFAVDIVELTQEGLKVRLVR